MDDHEREQLEELLDAITLAESADQVRNEISELQVLAVQAGAVEESGTEAKLHRLHGILQEQGFFDDPDQRLLIFTEFRDTLDYLMERLQAWGFRAGNIHGGMNPGFPGRPGNPAVRRAAVQGRGHPGPGRHRSRRGGDKPAVLPHPLQF